MRFRAASIAVTAGLVAGLAALPGTSSAGHQAPKNGCTSAARVAGSLTSASLSPGSLNQVFVQFRTWWEVEGRRPATTDRLRVEFSTDGGETYAAAGVLNPASSPGASPDVPLANTGLQTRPDWTTATIELPRAAGASDLRVRFAFDSVDRSFNGFRGWGIDDVVITSLVDPPIATFDFEGGLPPGWTGTGFWHVQTNPHTVSIAPGINPQLVTLGAGDDGTLPTAFSGARIAWFGEPATGTYCGASGPAENFPPSASFTVSPIAPKTSDTVTFDGSSSSDVDGPLASYTWDFGDGSPPAAGPVASHVYRRQGTYDVTLTVTDAAGATSTATVPLAVDSNMPDDILVANSLDELPNPRAFREVNIQPTGGDVFIRLPRPRGSAAQAEGAPRGFIPLTQSARLPIGSIVETSRGKIMLESARDTRRRRTQTAEFFNGRFSMRQPRARRPFTELILKGGTFRGCPSTRSVKGSTEAEESQRRRGRRSRVRRLWGNGRGRFRTRGRYSSATVRGTKWLVEDRCGETLTRVARRPRNSVVHVRDLGRRRTVRLTAGRRYVARPRTSRR